MRISKGLISVVSMASAMLLLCSCTVYDLGLSEGQIEKVISQIENEAQLSSEAASGEKNAEAPSSVAAASFSEAPKETAVAVVGVAAAIYYGGPVALSALAALASAWASSGAPLPA